MVQDKEGRTISAHDKVRAHNSGGTVTGTVREINDSAPQSNPVVIVEWDNYPPQDKEEWFPTNYAGNLVIDDVPTDVEIYRTPTLEVIT